MVIITFTSTVNTVPIFILAGTTMFYKTAKCLVVNIFLENRSFTEASYFQSVKWSNFSMLLPYGNKYISTFYNVLVTEMKNGASILFLKDFCINSE